MEFLDITKEGCQYKKQLFELYESAFPPEEKKTSEMLRFLVSQGRMEILAIVEDNTFIGLAIHLLSGKAALLDYFAITKEKRGQGYGGRIIAKLTEHFAGRPYIFEIEKQDSSADNALERKRRKAFYLRNGLKETGVYANVYHTDFELLTPDGQLTYGAYEEFLKEVLGEEIFQYISPYPLKG